MPLWLPLAALVLLALAPVAFWPAYLSKLSLADGYTHAHAVLGTCWLLLLVVQPLLIKASRRSWHRLLGPIGVLARAAFFVSGVLPETPWHISRFHPTYRLTDRPPTPVKTLRAAREIGLRAGLRYVYTGNVPGDTGENTFCPACGAALIERWGFQVAALRLKDGRCAECGAEIAGVWS